MPFTFKQFHIDDLSCGMAVSTDGVLLGAWAPLGKAKHILDIGAGSGLLSLMAAQRSQAAITSVELDPKAAETCRSNISNSPWQDRCKVIEGNILSLFQNQQYQAYFDHIICNPPYFEHGPKANDNQRAMARHTDSLSFSQLLQSIEFCLSFDGQASIVLPVQSLPRFMTCLNQSGLYAIERVAVKSVVGKTANRLLLLLGKGEKAPCKESELCVRTNDGDYTSQMVALTKDFYLKL
ncbi:methyltransferase [Shewanella sp. A25]|nr:methyltransferase [Shewanella shenzhenensis]